MATFFLVSASAACLGEESQPNGLVSSSNSSAELLPELVVSPHQVLGPDTCTKCHGPELQTWRQTRHFATFEQLHQVPQAKAIASRLGLRSIKRDGVCVQCHYTPQASTDEPDAAPRPIAGISCESCHGPAQNWLLLHNDYGAGHSAATESPQHAQARRTLAIQAGMRNPANVYLIARSCFNCHTIPKENLVNVGGHPASSAGFEFVAWSQGSVRHNFLRGGGTQNVPSSPERLRLMYVVGKLTELEYSLRALAQAEGPGTFAQSAAERAARARKELAQIQLAVRHAQLQPAIEAFAQTRLSLGNSASLEAAADKIGSVALQLADQEDGSRLSAVDALLPAPQQYK